MSSENKNDPNNVPSHLEQGLPTFEEAERQLQIEVFGAERLARDAGHEAGEVETLELKRAVLALMDDEENTVGNDKVATRTLQRRWKPPVELYLLASPEERGVEVSDTEHFLAQTPLRVKHLVFENVTAPQRKLARVLGIDAPLKYTASESIYFDQDNKAWVVRGLVYPHKTVRDALRDKEREAVQAIKPASHADIEKAYELLTTAAHEDDKIRAAGSVVK